MGINLNGARVLLDAKARGVDFSQSAMIGRQWLSVTPSQLRKTLASLGFSFEEGTIKSVFEDNGGYAEEFFKCLGADNIHSFDYSEYEGASHILDMNQPIGADLVAKYSVVFDGGTMEHIFNFPVAIRNCMRMLKMGGYYIGITPANNLMGHGFYQFSPELYFSIFTKNNGFEMVDVIAYEGDGKKAWYRVASPMAVKGRVTLINCKPVHLAIVARKVAETDLFELVPQQSDYVSTWQDSGRPSSPSDSPRLLDKSIVFMRKWTPVKIKRIVRRYLNSRRGFNRRWFSRTAPYARTETDEKLVFRHGPGGSTRDH